MKMPKPGTWVRVYWQDAHQTGRWEYGDDGLAPSVEVSTGLFRGVTKEARMAVTPTVSMRLDDGELLGMLTELSIPVGCILKIERLPAVKL